MRYLTVVAAAVAAVVLMTATVGAQAPVRMPTLFGYIPVSIRDSYCDEGVVVTVKSYVKPGNERSTSFDAVAMFVKGKPFPFVAILFEWGDDREDERSRPTTSTIFASKTIDGIVSATGGGLPAWPSTCAAYADIVGN